MGATDFYTRIKGKTAKEAFAAARAKALYDHGHSGYTGSIAEKHSFVMIPYTPGPLDPMAMAHQLVQVQDARIDDKWGPAGCFDLKDGSYLFFGWASE